MKTILCIDGGGVKGLAISSFLEQLEACLKKEKNVGLFDFFDMFVGTSTGSLIISAIAYEKMSGSDLVNKLYVKDNITKIMPGSSAKRDLRMLMQIPKYDGKGKSEILEKYLKNRTLNDSGGKDVMITAMNVSKTPDNTKSPILFKSWSKDAEFYLVRNVCDASSAAPVYFPTVRMYASNDDDKSENVRNGRSSNDATSLPGQSPDFELIGKEIKCIDGGLFANNPAICAYAEALKKYGKDEDIRILSIGTGIYYSDCEVSEKWGAEQWITKGDLLDLVLAGPQEITNDNVKEFTKAMGHVYVRVNGHLKDSSLDNTSDENLANLRKTGVEWWNTFSDEIKDRIIDNPDKKHNEEDLFRKILNRFR